MSILRIDQFDTGTPGEQRGQFDSHQAAWDWGKVDGMFRAEVIEYFGDEELTTERFDAKTLKSVLLAVRSATGSAWTSAVITHDNGKSRSVKL